ncbi:MAG: Peptidase protein [Acidobacteriota bacterium]|nr:Peptidase protein [Acidobacteriota bacterium]
MRRNTIILSFLILYFTALNIMSQEFPDTVIGINRSDYRVYLKTHAPLDRLYCQGEDFYFLVDRNELRQVEESGIEIRDRYLAPQENLVGLEISSSQGDINGAYHNYNETRSLLKELETRFPGMAQEITIGYSIEGRELNVIKISDNVQSNESEPNIFIVGCHHAREWISVEIPLLFAKYLLENYSLDPQVRRAVDGAQIYIMPIQNPDGLEFSIHTYRLWRKNRRYNGGFIWGVDTNRNYGYMWGYDDNGSSPAPDSEVYRGTAPFSEPETQALQQFLTANPPVGSLSFHSYGQDILYPWGYTFTPASDAARMYAIAREIAYRIFLVSGRVYTYGSMITSLYLSNGDFTDWVYGTLGGLAFTIELPPEYMHEGGFFTSEQMIASAFAENLPVLLYFTNYFITGSDEIGFDDQEPFREKVSPLRTSQSF